MLFLPSPIVVPIKKLKAAPWNFKVSFSSDDELERFAKSCKKGMTPLHCATPKELKKATYMEVCDGNHRLALLQHLGETHAQIFDHGVLSLNKRKEIGLRYNEWNFASDSTLRAQTILDVTETVADFAESMLYSDEELDLLADSLKMDGFEEKIPQYEPKPRKEKKEYKTIICPSCGEEFNLHEK